MTDQVSPPEPDPPPRGEAQQDKAQQASPHHPLWGIAQHCLLGEHLRPQTRQQPQAWPSVGRAATRSVPKDATSSQVRARAPSEACSFPLRDLRLITTASAYHSWGGIN